MVTEVIDESVTRILLEYAQSATPVGQLSRAVRLRHDLGIESLSLVAVVVRIGEELGVDVADSGVEVGELETVGDAIALAHKLNGLTSGNRNGTLTAHER
jgi:acyl carrier protein